MTRTERLARLDDYRRRGLITREEWTEAYRSEWSAFRTERLAQTRKDA